MSARTGWKPRRRAERPADEAAAVAQWQNLVANRAELSDEARAFVEEAIAR